ncbi:MAG: hypothetical protein GY722_19000 [bacterium]|nr:hypothetical protein [bacterium]
MDRSSFSGSVRRFSLGNGDHPIRRRSSTGRRFLELRSAILKLENARGRITDYGASYPGGLTGSIHTDGQIWSTCNVQIWDAP